MRAVFWCVHVFSLQAFWCCSRLNVCVWSVRYDCVSVISGLGQMFSSFLGAKACQRSNCNCDYAMYPSKHYQSHEPLHLNLFFRNQTENGTEGSLD